MPYTMGHFLIQD